MTRRRRAPRISPTRLTLLTHETEPPTPVILGKGTYGTVYSGILDGAHPIALKATNPYPHLVTLPVTVQSAHDAHARHEQEAQLQLCREEYTLAAARRSPGVVRLYGTCHGGLVLERLHKRPLPGDVTGKVRFCAEVATAVSGLHRLKISHGDVKLGNVMFSNGVKLIDFGLSCTESCNDDTIGRGSAAYLAPEGWGRVQGVEQRMKVDVYALGMLIYEVFCGVPWRDVEGVAVRVLNGERPEWRVGEDRIREVVQACWRQDPDMRPNAELVAGALREIERGFVGPIGPNFGKIAHNSSDKEDSIHDSSKGDPKSANTEMDEPDVQVSARSVNPYLMPAPAAVEVPGALVDAALPGTTVEPASLNELEVQAEGLQEEPAQHDDVVLHVTEVAITEEGPLDPNEQPEIIEDVQVVEGLDSELEPQEQRITPQTSSSGYLPEREAQSPSSTTGSPAPMTPQKLDYPFKQQIEANDLRSLIQVLNNSRHDRHRATLVLEAITVLLVTPPNPELFSSSLSTLSALTSRNTTPRLAKAACLVIHRLATNPTSATERALRISAAYDIIATSLKRHPTELPVVLTATTAMHALASSSPPQCSILVDQGAPTAALRSLARATRTFKNDLPIASASLQTLDVMSRQHAPRLVADGAVEAIMSAVGSFSHAQIDRLALPTLIFLCSDDEGRRRGVNGVGAVAGAVSRSAEPRTLFQAYVLLAELAKETAAATNAFSGSTVVEAVLGSLEDNVDADEKLVQAGFACLTGMSRLGGDICGSLEIMQVFDLVYNLVNSRPGHRGTALGAAVFLDEILKELRNASHAVNMDLPFSMLVQLQERWPRDSLILRHCKNAIRVVREATGRSVPVEEEPRSSLRSFVKKFSTRKNNSLRVGGSGG